MADDHALWGVALMAALWLGAALALAATAEPSSAPPAEPQLCSLVTPAGDAISFTIVGLSDASDEIGLVPSQESVWPERTLPAARGFVKPEPPGNRWFALGGGDGLVVELGSAGPVRSRRPAVLLRRHIHRAGLPLAYGFCEAPAQPITVIYAPVDPAADPTQVGQGLPAFDVKRWSERSCAVLLDNGRRTSLRFAIKPGNALELASPLLWRGKTLRLPIRWSDAPGAQVGTFGRRGGPAGTQTMIVDGGAAGKLIHFADVGDESMPGVTGYGICGYQGVTKKAVIE
jgi:hypothetical protein